MSRLHTLKMVLALAVFSLVVSHPAAGSATAQTSPAVPGGPSATIAQVSLTDLSDLPTRFGGASGGVLGDRK